jgi:DNA-binding NtrC family response regulator
MATTKLSFIARNSVSPQYVELEEGDVLIVGRASGDSFSIDRDDSGAIVHAPISTLSERHARITLREGVVQVEDLSSRNGTLLRLHPFVPEPLEDRAIWLGPDLAVRREDNAPPTVIDPTLNEEEFVRTINARLALRGLSAVLCEPDSDTIALVGCTKHVRIEDPAGSTRTVDALEQQWIRAAVARYNAAKSEARDLRGWRFQAASSARRDAITIAADVARTRLPVLLIGESGSGKDVLAQDLHDHSLACSGPWVPVNCAALPKTLVEAELFGHARGSFTGATHERAGLVQAADHGTLFLDEVGDLTESAQAALLRFLESERGEYRRVGESKLRYSRVRVIAATNRDLPAAMRAGTFRVDLFHRLAAVQIRVAAPDREDLRVIARSLLRGACERERLETPPDMIETLSSLAAARAWPGHVRELRHAIERWAQIYAPRYDALDAWQHAVGVTSRAASVPADPPARLKRATSVGRMIADVIFLEAALASDSRATLARTLDVTYQGADRRLSSMNLSIDDKQEIAARLDEVIAQIRAMLGDSADLQSLFKRFNPG